MGIFNTLLTSGNAFHVFQVSLAYYAQIFTYYASEQCSKNLPIMLNIIPMATTIMPPVVQDLNNFND